MAQVKYIKVVRPVETSCITNPGDLPVCNKKIISRIAKMNRTTETQVTEILSFIGKYTKEVITGGIMETVMLPYFGKFKPKVKELQAQAMMIREIKAGKHAIMKKLRQAKALEESKKKKS